MTLADDLALLAIGRRGGLRVPRERLRYGLCGAELVELVGTRRIEVRTSGGPIRLVVRDATPTGDARLDRALRWLGSRSLPPHPTAWVGHADTQVVDAYLARLVELGAIAEAGRRDRASTGERFRRIKVVDPSYRTAVMRRLDRVAASAEPADDPRDTALAALVQVIGLDRPLYRSPSRIRARRRLARIAERDWGAITVRRGVPPRHAWDYAAGDSARDLAMASDLMLLSESWSANGW